MAKKRLDPAGATRKIGSSTASDQSREGPVPPFCDKFDIRIAADGTWFYKNSPIERPAMVRLFARVLRREPDGGYWLVTPIERVRVEVEDAPFTAVELIVTGQGRAQSLAFVTSVDDRLEAGPDNPIRVAAARDKLGPKPYIKVRHGLEALILRSVYYRLADLAVEHEVDGVTILGVWSNKVFFPLE